jgi:hypothetical protein
LARTIAPWMVAFIAGVSPPAVRIPMRLIDLPCGGTVSCPTNLY